MSRVLPILFNTEMVLAILDGRKTVTRRLVKYKYDNTEIKIRTDKYGTRLIEIQKNVEGETYGKNSDGSTWHKLLPYIEKNPPCKKGDILYIRETWGFAPCSEMCENACDTVAPDFYMGKEGCFVYKANYGETEDDSYPPSMFKWRPSIHMPKEAARIWLKVTNVRVERLQKMWASDVSKEGMTFTKPHTCEEMLKNFSILWNSTIKKSDIDRYGWDANPWVWVIEFERCEKPGSEE